MLAKLKDAYTHYFNDVALTGEIPHLAANYEFYCTNECYVISKKVKLWSAETNEYVYVFSMPELTDGLCAECIDRALAQGLSRIHPHLDHKSSFVTAVFVCDHVDKGAESAIARTRIHKDFWFSLKGWMDLRAAALDLSTGRATVNSAAKELKDFLLGNLAKCNSIEEELH